MSYFGKAVVHRSSQNNFVLDSQAPSAYQATNADYLNSGFDKGHLAPAGIFSFDADEYDSTFTFSNVAPQNKKFNEYSWQHSEYVIRNYLYQNSDTYIHLVTGLHFLGGEDTIGRAVIPTAYYTGFYDPVNKVGAAFYGTNDQQTGALKDLPILTIQDLEDKLGRQVFPGLSDKTSGGSDYFSTYRIYRDPYSS